jgi:hypothetical protein
LSRREDREGDAKTKHERSNDQSSHRISLLSNPQRLGSKENTAQRAAQTLTTQQQIPGTSLAHRRVEVLAMKARLFVMLAVTLSAAGMTAAEVRDATVPAGTVLRVRLENSVGSDISRVEAPVHARLMNPIVVGGRTVVPAGSAVTGSVTQAIRSGKVRGRARLGMRFHSLEPAGDSERYRISTNTWSRVAPGTKKKDAATIAIPATGGAIVGGIVGGKKGAAIGAAAGGGGGTAVVLSTRGKEVRLGRGAVVLVRLTEPLTLNGR